MSRVVGSGVRRVVLAYSVRNRQRKAAMIQEFMRAHALRTVVLVGVAGESDQRNEDVLERAVGAAGQVVGSFNVYPAVTPWPFVVADARAMPFRDAAADLVISSAIVEHVGDEADQRRFVAEHRRVGRAWVITTPNRWFPVESHTSTLLRHWSPSWRRGREEFTRLLSRRELRDLLPRDSRIVGRPWSPTFTAFWVADDRDLPAAARPGGTAPARPAGAPAPPAGWPG